MKSILLHINNDPALEARIQLALDMARAHDAHVTFLQAVSYEVFAPGDFYGSAMAAVIPKIKEAAEELRAKVEGDLSNEDVSWEWQFHYGMAEMHLLEQSALQDVIIVGPHGIGEPQGSASRMIGDLLFKAQAPVLVVPESTKRLDCSAPIMIAWNGSQEACLALRQSVPLLKGAGEVILASVKEEKEEERFDFPPVDGAEYLSRHGIVSEIVELPRNGEPIADTLFSAAEKRKCGLVVMGAYGHSRIAETILGGVTRRALSDPKLPILLAH